MIVQDPIREVLTTLQVSKNHIIDPTITKFIVTLRATIFAQELRWKLKEML